MDDKTGQIIDEFMYNQEVLKKYLEKPEDDVNKIEQLRKSLKNN